MWTFGPSLKLFLVTLNPDVSFVWEPLLVAIISDAFVTNRQ